MKRLHPHEISPKAISVLYEIQEVLETDLGFDSRYNYIIRATKHTIYVAKQKRNIRPNFVFDTKEKSTPPTETSRNKTIIGKR